MIRNLLIVVIAFVFLSANHAGSRERTAENLSIRGVTVVPADSSRPTQTYRIVLACTDQASRALGLQGFRPLSRDEAALFVFEKPEPVSFWMGSVTFPIDIIFIKEDGSIIAVQPGCKPGSRDIYRSGQAVKWVVETAAGSGVKVGDRVKIE